MPSPKSLTPSVRTGFYGKRPRFTSPSTRPAHTLTRKSNLKNTSNPALKELLNKAFAIVKSAKKSAKSANAGPRRETTSSLRRATLAALKEKKEEAQKVADALRIHNAEMKKEELRIKIEKKAQEEALAKLEQEKAEASRIAAAKEELEEKRKMLREAEVTSENMDKMLDELSRILKGFHTTTPPLSPIKEGGRRTRRRSRR